MDQRLFTVIHPNYNSNKSHPNGWLFAMALEQGTIPEGSELSACRVVPSQTCPEPVEGWEGIVLISILCEKGLSLSLSGNIVPAKYPNGEHSGWQTREGS